VNEDSESDVALVRRARTGDREAFGALIERHQPAVAGFLVGVLRDLDLAEETAQEAFVKAYVNLASFEGRSNFKTWVSHIALNAARSRQRWSGLRQWLSLDAPRQDASGAWEEQVEAAAPDEFAAVERRLEFDRAMTGLGRREREITAMRLEGYDLNEIADILRITEGTVKSTLFTATRKMREKLS
jgi:RNA polymerase sigma-70 factor (ECF subfamily)